MKPPNKKRYLLSSIGIFSSLVLATFVFIVATAQSTLPGKALTTDPANDMRPSWSPDGSLIAFFSLRSGNYDIWVMDSDGQNQRQLTDDPADDRRPAWSPDGKYIAFDSDRGGPRDIWVLNLETNELRQFTSGPGIDSFPAWSPDGSQIAFYSYEDGIMDVWVASIEEFLNGGDPGQPRRLTQGLADEEQNGCTFGCHTPTWSPDSKTIAYVGNNHTQVWVIGADGSNPHIITSGGEHEHFPTWTSDGNLIMLHEHLNSRDEYVNDVWLVDPTGSNDATLLFTDIPHGGPFYWSPTNDGMIAFHSPREGNFDIYYTILGREDEFIEEEIAVPEPETDVEPTAVLPPTEAPLVAVQEEDLPASVTEPSPLTNPTVLGGFAVALGGVAFIVIYLVRKGREGG